MKVECFFINKKWLTLFVTVLLATAMVGCSDNNNAQIKRDAKSKQNHNIIKQDGRVHFTLGDREFDIPTGNFRGGGDWGWPASSGDSLGFAAQL